MPPHVGQNPLFAKEKKFIGIVDILKQSLRNTVAMQKYSSLRRKLLFYMKNRLFRRLIPDFDPFNKKVRIVAICTLSKIRVSKSSLFVTVASLNLSYATPLKRRPMQTGQADLQSCPSRISSAGQAQFLRTNLLTYHLVHL